MAQQLRDLLKLYSDMSSEEQLEHIREIRRKRYVERPGAKRRAASAAKPKVNKAKKLLDGLSASDLERLLKEADDE